MKILNKSLLFLINFVSLQSETKKQKLNMYLRIKELMKKKGVSSKELSDALGKSSTQISLIINEKSYTSIPNYQAIADFLGVDLTDLFKSNPSITTNIVRGFVKIGDNIREITNIYDLLDAARDATALLNNKNR